MKQTVLPNFLQDTPPVSSIGQISIVRECETSYDAYGEGEDEGKERELGM